MKVLIVEDNDNDRSLLELIMKHHGWDVLVAKNGIEAMEILEKQKPDLIVSDILMPRMDGFELLWSIKNKEDTKNIPFIFYSAIYTGEKDKILAIALGAEAFIEKPKEPEELFETIKEVFHSIKTVKLPDLRIIKEEEFFLKAYSHIVASKLDQKVRELEELNREYAKLYNEHQTLLDGIPDSICLLDKDLKIRWVNSVFQKDFNKKAEEIIGKHCYSVIHQFDTPCEGCSATRVLRTKNVEVQECETKDGRTWDVRVIPLKNEQGEVINLIEILRDITEQKKTKEQLINVQRMEAIGLLAGGIAHDFRNMLTPIIGFAHLIKMQIKEDSIIYDYANKIIAAAEKASELAQGLLAFSRKQLLEMKPLLVDNLIEDFTKIISRIIGEDIELKIRLNSGKNLVIGDITQIKQIIMNLITNARDAMPKGGVLSINTELIDMDDNFIKFHGFGKPGKYVLISVSDTGVGIEETIKSRIFEPFFTTKSPDRGTGLGLAIVYGIVKQHGGYVDVYSKPGFGSTFNIYLPSKDIPFDKEREIVQKVSEITYGSGELILLIEDDDNVRNYLKKALEHGNYQIVEARNGFEGIEKYLLNKDKIKLVILDIIMPLKNGKETLDEIKKIEPSQKYIFISGYPSEIIFEKGMVDSNIEFLSKPISPMVLLQKVKEVLSS